MSYSPTFNLWKNEAGQSWSDYTNHKFVKGLGDGSLPAEAFIHYLSQDYLFLIQYSKAWALAITKAETPNEMRLAASTLNGLINDEIKLHIKACSEYGISENDLLKLEERPESIAYTRYVLDSGHSGDLLDLLAALMPCILGYGEIGHTLMQQATSDVYDDWINAYSSSTYQKLCEDMGDILEVVVQQRLGVHPQTSPRWKGLCRRFKRATELEAGFWDMGLRP